MSTSERIRLLIGRTAHRRRGRYYERPRRRGPEPTGARATAPRQDTAFAQPPHRPLGIEQIAIVEDEFGSQIFFHPDDRKYGTLLMGSQGSGKTAAEIRLYVNDLRDANAAQIVFDPKTELAKLCLAHTHPACGKTVWYLDLGRPDFGMNPLHIEDKTDFVTAASAVADNVVAALLDLNEGQIFESSKRYLNHAILGELALAEHHGYEPRFEGVYELLLPQASGQRAAAIAACRRWPDLLETANFYERELPGDLELSPSKVAERLDPPRNKIARLISRPAVQRFLNHPSEISLSQIIAARDVLIVDANMAAIGEENSTTCMALIFQMLHQQMQKQMQKPAAARARVALIVDEAHYLISETVIDQVATHRAAGLDVTFALQFPAQLGAGAPSAAITEKIRTGVMNLVQTRLTFRLGEPKDAEDATRIAMAVYETQIRADTTSRQFYRVTPEMLMNLPVYKTFVSMISNGTRAASFVGCTFAFDVPRSTAWADHHLWELRERVAGYQMERGFAGTLRKKHDVSADASPKHDPPSAPDLATDDRAAAAHGVGDDTGAATDRDAVVEHEPVRPRNFVYDTPPEREVSAVLRVVGQPWPDAPEDPSLGRAAPELLEQLAFVDRVESHGEWETIATVPGSELRAQDVPVVKVLDRMGRGLRYTVGRAALGPDARPRTAQYRLKELHDRGFVSRARVLVKDSQGGAPQYVYTLTRAGFEAAKRAEPQPAIFPPDRKFKELEGDGDNMGHDHAVVHWLLMIESLLGPDVVRDNWRTPRVAGGLYNVPLAAAKPNARGARKPVTLLDVSRHLRAGEAITGLACLATPATGGKPPGFAAIYPDLTIEMRVANARRGPDAERLGLTFDVMVEMDRTARGSYNESKLFGYDAFLTAWWLEVKRYQQLETRPAVVFVSRTWKLAAALAAKADAAMTGAVTLPGQPEKDWHYAGREHVFFAAEEDAYHASPRALALHPLPPRVRADLGVGAHPQPHVVALFPPSMINAAQRKRGAS